jgi:hypothetical protein
MQADDLGLLFILIDYRCIDAERPDSRTLAITSNARSFLEHKI